MLSVAKIRAGRAGYYLATVAAEDGAKGRGSLIEPDGYWLGSGAERLGLGGRAEAEAVRRILAGRHPYGGESLLDTRSRNRSVGAYDCTFSVPKSVSVLEALGAPEHAEAVRAAHATSVAGAVAYLESEAVRLRRSTADGRRSLPGDGVVAVAFPHSSSRAPDPHLHTHVLVANLVADGAGRWQCLDARRWYLELQAAAHLCEAGLRAELTTRLGVTWSEMRGSYADLRGISAEAVRAYSRRSVEIARLMSESRLTGPKASALLAAASRPRKDLTVSREELVGAWRERSWRLGISAGMLEDVAGRRPIGGAPEVPSSWQARTLEQVSTSSSGRSFDRRDLIRARCRTALDGRSAAGVLEDVDRLLASGLVARRAPVVTFMRTSAGMMPAGERDERYVTAQSLALESRLVEEMRALPADVSVIAYGPGQRMAALAGATCAPGASGLAPGLAAARSLEALTGVASVHSSELLEEASRRIVIADAHRLSSLQIERAVASARASSSEIALVVPEKELGRDALLAGVARSCRLEPVGEGAVEGAVGPIAEHAARKRPELDFGDVKAVVVSSLYEARQAVLERASARGAVVVTGDGAVASWLSHEASGDQKQPLAVRPGDQKQPLAVRPGEMEQRGVTVLTSRELRRLFESVPAERLPPVVVLGGASELRLGATALERLRRDHVVVMAPAGPGAVDGDLRARVAEAVQPAYLRKELGSRRDVPAERALWRQGAELIEVLRRDHGIDSPRHALGTAKDLRHAPGSTRLAIETARVRLQVIAHELSSARLSRQQARPGLEMASLQRTLPAREHVGGRHLAPGMER